MNTRGLRKRRVGTVIGDSMNKSVVVAIDTITSHPVYGKYVRKRTKCVAHDESDECKVGDRVLIVECRPLSKTKRWRVREVVQTAL